MSTTDDIFWLYERNKNIYSDCIKKNRICNNLIDNKCYCYIDDIVYPITVGDQDVKCIFKVKSYIKIGEECPICMEGIFHKINAYITGCGHSFHRKCLSKVFQTKWKTKAYSVLRCPICRASQGFPDMFSRYNINSGELDNLENFWITKDCQMGTFCNINHYIGMKKNCLRCINYRNTGEI